MIQNKSSPKAIINCAAAADDAELCRLLREIQMAGQIDVAFTRELGYFNAAQVEGEKIDVLVARDRATGQIVGLGSRAEKNCYLNGQSDRIGYLSGLRCKKEYRQGTLVGRGFRFLKKLHQAGDVKFYLTSIIEDNQVAKNVLTSGKAGLPTYKDFGRFHTLLIRPQKKSFKKKPANLRIRKAHKADICQVTEFLNRSAMRRQFFPIYETKHFDKNDGLLKNMRLSDVYLATKKGRLIGTLGIWDQKSFKQCVIKNYSRGIKTIRPFFNLYAKIGKRPELPKPETILNYLTLALISVENDDTDIFESLFRNALRDVSNVDNLHSVMVGFHERDPFLPIAKRIPHMEYLSRIYLAFWQDGQSILSTLDDRIPYIELGAL